MRKIMGAAALALLASAAPAAAQEFVAFTGQLVAEKVAAACEVEGQSTMFGERDETFSGVFIPGELNTDPYFQKTTFAVRNKFFAFSANVRTDPSINPNGALVANAKFDGIYLDGLGTLRQRSGRVSELSFTPTYSATSTLLKLSVRLTNVQGLPGCTVTFSGVFARVE